MKDAHRILLAIVASLAILLLWQYLMPAKPAKTPAQPAATEQKAQPSTAAQPAQPPAQPQAQAPAAASAPDQAKAPDQQAAPLASGAQAAPAVKVETPLYLAEFSSLGGSLKKLVLKKYNTKPENQGEPFTMVDLPASGPGTIVFSLPKADPQLGMRMFSADRGDISLSQGQAVLTFSAQGNGVKVIKRYTFHADSYVYDLKVRVINTGATALEVVPELMLSELAKRSEDNPYAFTGLQAYRDNSLVEHDAGDLEDKPVVSGAIDFADLSIPYFMGAMVPLDQPGTGAAKRSVRGEVNDGVMQAVLVSQPLPLAAGQEVTLDYLVFYGPRDLKVLEPLGHNLAAAVDFGWFDIIAKPMLAALNFIYDFLPNYGVAIIIITILIKFLFWPLTRKSYRSMKEMQKVQPQVAKIREKYKGDKQKMQQEIMQLYKAYKVNPMGGCLPMVVQIPVFIAFYKVLGASIELRHAPFLLWINDLAAPDRLFPDLGIPYVGGLPVMTLLMGASMFVQQKMSPTTGDPTQAKMMMLMPVVFTFLFINFPSGLVLYWLVNNLLSIGQQWMVNRKA